MALNSLPRSNIQGNNNEYTTQTILTNLDAFRPFGFMFPCIFDLGKLLMLFFARMQRYQLGARFYNFPPSPMIFRERENKTSHGLILCTASK